jgi:REP element-mobilizing transposase RayT
MPITPQPLYTSQNVVPAYQLRYTWAGWPTRGQLPATAPLDQLAPLWEQDGLRLLEHKWSSESVQLTFSTRPDVSPVFLAARAKGRLQHAMHRTNARFAVFSRKVSVRALGENTTQQVLAYIAAQVGKEHFVDRRFEESMKEFTVVCRDVDLAKPTESARGRYWYNLHVVLVAEGRCPTTDRSVLARIRDGCFQIAKKKGYAIGGLSVMPDHLHVALRGAIQQSPQETALAFQNNLAWLLGQVRIWRDGFYAGTFGEYDMGAIRAEAGG